MLTKTSWLSKSFKFLLDCVFPVACLDCGAYDYWLCLDCRKKIKSRPTTACPFCGQPAVIGETCPLCRTEHYLDGLLSFFSYADEKVREIIKIWKYQGVASLIDPIGLLIKDDLLASKKDRYFLKNKNSVIVPIPLHKRRERERGFNQSALLAEIFAGHFSMPIEQNNLVRVKETKPQSELKNHESRFENIKKCFSVLTPKNLFGKNIFLIDDVSTSGATFLEAACVLKKSGARKIIALAAVKG